MPVVSLGVGSSYAAPVAGSPTSKRASVASSAPEVCPGVRLWKFSYLMYIQQYTE